MAFPEPPKSKSAVRKAGKAIAEGAESQQDIDIVDQWRAAHGYVLNTFKVWLRDKIKKKAPGAEFAQRLKRRNTVIDKLRRVTPSGEPLIRDVTAMQDFAGCRLIFDNVAELRSFEEYLLSKEVLSNVLHRPRHTDREKYDYIQHPKVSGYRGVHHVFYHVPRSHRATVSNSEPWHNLMVEIQLRTRAQHAWATALEIADLVSGTRTKFEFGDNERGRLFAITSEIIARKHENIGNAFLGKSTEDLLAEFQALEDRLGVISTLKTLREFDGSTKLRKHNVLNIYDLEGHATLEVLPFRNAQDALRKANELEADPNSYNAVYVTADNPSQLRSAYRNYFNDPIAFVDLLEKSTR